MRKIVVDTETTGISRNSRVIEIAAIELLEGGKEEDENTKFHYYLNPGPRVKVHEGAYKVHGISTEFLQDKPSFAQIAEDFIKFIRGTKMIIHNAPFDLYHLNFEMALYCQSISQDFIRVEDICAEVEDTLPIARRKFPGQSNSLDALIDRFGIDSSSRDDGHGALIDVRLLAKVYEQMSVTQSKLDLNKGKKIKLDPKAHAKVAAGDLKVQKPNEDESAQHKKMLKELGISSYHQ